MSELGAQSKTGRSWLVVIGLVSLVLLAGTLLYLVSSYEVLEKGRLLPYTQGKIYKVRFAGGLTLFVEPEQRPSLDLLNAYLLAGAAFVSLTFATMLAATREAGSARFWFFLGTFLGGSVLAADEILGIHESVGHNLQFLLALPLVERPDDAVIVFGAVPVALFFYCFRSVILVSGRATTFLGIGLLGFLLSAIGDVLTMPLEEVVEVVATGFLVAAMLTLGLDHLRSDSRAAPEPPAGH